MSKCEEIYRKLTWFASAIAPAQYGMALKFISCDFHFWAVYGSWAHCPHCGSFFFNDSYFRERVYQDQATSEKPDLLAAYRRRVPSDPCTHSSGAVGISSRWWYLPQMYKVICHCERCTKPESSAGARFTAAMRAREANVKATIDRTQQLYRIPRVRAADDNDVWARECVTWPQYRYGSYDNSWTSGECMLSLSEEDCSALQIVVLRTNCSMEKFSARGLGHHMNWKKTGLSRAYFKDKLVEERSMPSPKAKAAFRYLMKHNHFYKTFQQMQVRIIREKGACNISSYDLFIVFDGIECAMFPVLYPNTDFTDTGVYP